MFEKITVIANPIAGKLKHKKNVIDYVTNYFSNNGQEVTLKLTSKRGDAADFAVEAVKNKVDLVIAVGGDGTLNEVGTGLIHSDVTLGMIPMGSGNGLTRSLKIPQKVEQACELITQGCVSAIDVGKANERYFFLVAGMGFDAVVGKKFDENPGRGPLPYFYFSFKEYFAYKPQIVKISFNDKSFEISPFVIAVANGQQYGNNAMIAPAAKLNDGLLDVCIVHRLTFLQAFTALPKLFNGQLEKYQEAEFHQSQTVWIERPAPDYINIDGEPVLEEAEVHISILPESLNVITPQNCPSLIK